FVQRLLMGRSPGHGISGSQHWGLAQVLWAPQGQLAIPALASDVDGLLRQRLSGAAEPHESGPLEKRIEERYRAIFTSTGAYVRGKNAPTVARLAEALESARAQLAEVRARHTEFDEQSRCVEDARAANKHA